MNIATQPSLFDRLEETAAFLRRRAGGFTPAVGLVLGSGLGGFADRFEGATAVDYGDIPHFPVSGVEGHSGRLVLGTAEGVACVAMQGRVHYYEGHDLATVTFPVRVLIHLGAKTLIITNSAGGANPELSPGTLMLIRDHLNLIGGDPLRGPHDPRLGDRFPDMTYAYHPELRELARRAADAIGLELAEGVYAGLHGPSYETPAEIHRLRLVGADAVGMSTVPEVIVANQMKARVLGISCITNAAAGTTGERLTHDEVIETANRVRARFEELLREILRRIRAAAPEVQDPHPADPA